MNYINQIKLIVFIVLCATTFVSYGQTKVQSQLDSTSVSENLKTIVLMENDLFIVSTSYKVFIDNLNQFIVEFEVNADKELLNLFINDTTDVIVADSLAKTDKNKSRLIFQVSDLLENGNCLIFNKKSNQIEKSISIANYSTIGVAGRRFKTINNHLLLETIDRVY